MTAVARFLGSLPYCREGFTSPFNDEDKLAAVYSVIAVLGALSPQNNPVVDGDPLFHSIASRAKDRTYLRHANHSGATSFLVIRCSYANFVKADADSERNVASM